MKDLRRGSIAVEAAFVMPIVILTIFAMIYLSFYLHDRCSIQAEVDKVIHKAGITVKHDADIITGAMNYETLGDRGVFYMLSGSTEEDKIKIEKYLTKELSKELFLAKDIAVKADVNKLTINITVEAASKVTLPLFSELLASVSQIKITESCPVHNPAETVRAADVILETGSKIKGVEEFRQMLGKLTGKE